MHFVLKLSKLCNLRCTYCNEYDELANKDRMPLEGLEFFIEGVADFALQQRAQGKQPSEFRFVFHGGEPLLLPDEYLASLKACQRRFLDRQKISYQNFLQTNLFRVTQSKIELLKSLEICLGVSVDVFGEQRMDSAGKDSQDRVIDNLQMLNDRGYLNSPGIGAISVLHRGNIAQAERIYDFFNELRISYRILPIESGTVDVAPLRFQNLMLTNQEKVEVLQRVADRHARLNKGIRVLPLDDYDQSARHYLDNVTVAPYGFADDEWALIINTNGDAFNSGDEYRSNGYMGNIFRQRLADIFASEAYAATVAMRRDRMKTCDGCSYRNACTRIPVAEMHACEREYDVDGRLQCSVAFPLIKHYVGRSSSGVSRSLGTKCGVSDRRNSPSNVSNGLVGSSNQG